MASLTALNLPAPNYFSIYESPNTTINSSTLAIPFLPSSKSLTRCRRSLRLHRQTRLLPVVASAQSNFLKVVQTAWKIGKDGIEAGTDLVPNSIPRPIARIGVGGVLLSISLFVLKSLLSTAFFVLAVMGLIYFVFIALNKDEGPRGGGGGGSTMSDDTSLEEARRIMEKYK